MAHVSELGQAGDKQRKTVTVIFCDVVGSTALGESRDPEAVERLLVRYFDRMREIVELHGGKVEKFIGDAVVAVFGVPAAHEDDALRALRAAAEMRAALPALELEARIGVNSGEIVTSGHGTLVTGDAVNVAARLEQAASPGEILVGAPTLALAASAVVEELEPLVLKGKAEPVPAFRLLAVGPPERRHADRFVGRVDELALLRGAWERALTEERCLLTTVVGDPGIGKSRLVEELIAGLGARTVRGHCLSYGEGITYFPVVEVIKQLGNLPEEPGAARALRALLGESDAATTADEIAWAFRKLLEQSAPLLVVFDDIQWGEETFLDLVEHAALLAAAPLLLLCLARPELSERRPQWPVTLRLGPLPPAEVEELLPAFLPGSLRVRIARAAGGNPLFLTEMVAVAAEDGEEVVVPPTLKALLAARLDRLERGERSVLQRGAVEGELFHRGVVHALAPAETELSPRLTALVRKELIRPDRAIFPADDGFRFCHLLIRDAAYDALPKAARAELHERFADWLDAHGAGFVERDEVAGYHLEQAYRYRVDIGPADAAAEALASRAAERLIAAGRRARDRTDWFGAISLLTRAADLYPPSRPALLLQIAELNYLVGNHSRSLQLLDEAAQTSHAGGDEAAELVATVWRARVACEAGDPSVPFEKVVEVADRARAILGRSGDDDQVAQVDWHAAAYRGYLGRGDEAAPLYASAIEHAQRAGDRHRARVCLEGIIGSKSWGSTPVSEFLTFLDEMSDEFKDLLTASEVPHHHAALMAAYSGDFARAHAEYAVSQRIAAEFANPVVAAAATMFLGMIELLKGNADAAELVLREGYDRLDGLGAQGYQSTMAALLAEALLRQGRTGEAEELLDVADKIAQPDDIDTHVRSRATRARILARRGAHTEAGRLSDSAVRMAAPGNNIVLHGTALLARADVLGAAGAVDEAEESLRRALELFTRKENVVQAEQTRRLLSAVGAS
jgi:class 3 adenylate cyclase/tetratricopeptide (TPR) repeat protein